LTVGVRFPATLPRGEECLASTVPIEKWSQAVPDAERLTRLCELQALRNQQHFDAHTWADLDGDLVFSLLSKGASVLGSLKLLSWLSAPIQKASQISHLRAREAASKHFDASSAPWKETQQALAKLPWLPGLLVKSLWASASLPKCSFPPWVLAGAAVLAPFGFLVSKQLGAAAVLVVFVVNLAFHMWSARKLEASLASLSFISALLQTAKMAARIRAPDTEALIALNKKLAPLFAVTTELSWPAVFDLFPAEYWRIFVLTRERRLNRATELIERLRPELIEVFELLGALEAAACIATFRDRRETSIPVFEGQTLELKQARHPLLPEGTGNDVLLQGGLIVTGSNMSGKSTFLRTVSLNTLFAQTLGFACASDYRAPLLQMATSLRSQDDVRVGQSSFSAESHRLQQLTGFAEPFSLLLIDEPFRGTNSNERIAAGIALLRYLRQRGALVIVATHDVEILRALEPFRVGTDVGYDAGYFTERVESFGVSFDYALKLGRSAPQNALRVLESLGFPPEILEHAADIIEQQFKPEHKAEQPLAT
jgi:MutS domain V